MTPTTILTASGLEFDFLNPDPDAISISDIAYAPGGASLGNESTKFDQEEA